MEKLIELVKIVQNSYNKLRRRVSKLEKDGTPVSSDNISDATTIGKNLIKATDAAAARTAIGAGTSNLAIGTTASTAKAGNYVPTSAEVSTALKAKTQINALVSPTADYADLTAATAAIKSIIDALKA